MRWLQHLVPIAGCAAFLVALEVLRHQLAGTNYHLLLHDLEHIPLAAVLAALALTAVDYWALTAYDLLSLHAVRKTLAYPKVAATAFMAYAFSHNLGYAVLSGGAMRWRFYSSFGLANVDIAAITLIGGAAYWVGFLIVGGITMLVWPPHLDWLSPLALRVIGAATLALVAAAIAALLWWRKPMRWRSWSLPPLAIGPTLELLLVACLDWLLVIAVVWVLLPPLQGITYERFIGCFMLSLAAGNVSQVPGGLGVLEVSLLLMLGGHGATPAIAGALLAYRAIYFLLPFVSAMALLCVIEGARNRLRLRRAWTVLTRLRRPLLPQAAAALTFIAGAVLLLSGATPPTSERIGVLAAHLPYVLIDGARLAGSVGGMALLLAGRGLQLRRRGSWLAAMAIMPLCALCCAIKGLDIEEALALLACMVLIAPFGRAFQRRVPPPALPMRWILAAGSVLACCAWVSWFCFHHQTPSGRAWWHSGASTDAARSLRADCAALATFLVVVSWRALRRDTTSRAQPAASASAVRAPVDDAPVDDAPAP